MGCCVSSQQDSHLPQKPTLANRAPPPSSDEETVKEVLSVTDPPKPKPLDLSSKPQLPLRKIDEHMVGNEKILEKQSIFHGEELDSPTATDKTTGDVVYESASEDVSEVCSLSFSESVSTATINEKRDEDEEVRQRVFRSPAKAAARNRELVAKRNRVMGRSPTRKSDQSPGKTNGGGSGRVVQSREPGPRTPIRATRPDASESTGRRSRSPAVNRSVMGRSSSLRRVNNSPGRVRVESGKINKVEEENGNMKNGAPNESLENPLVSLECFIFL